MAGVTMSVEFDDAAFMAALQRLRLDPARRTSLLGAIGEAADSFRLPRRIHVPIPRWALFVHQAAA